MPQHSIPQDQHVLHAEQEHITEIRPLSPHFWSNDNIWNG